MKDKVKLFLRITHSYLDSEIESCIASAKAEMLRVGISQSAIDEQDPLVEEFIKVYCGAQLENDKDRRQGFQDALEFKLENLRRSSDYYV